MSLVCLSAESKAMKMVLMTERDWVELTAINLGQLKEFQKETNLVCLLAESMDMQLATSLVSPTDVGSEKLTETPMEMHSD